MAAIVLDTFARRAENENPVLVDGWAIPTNTTTLIVSIGGVNPSNPSHTVPSDVTAGGVAMTKLSSSYAPVGIGSSIWVLQNPPIEIQQISATFAGASEFVAIGTFAATTYNGLPVTVSRYEQGQNGITELMTPTQVEDSVIVGGLVAGGVALQAAPTNADMIETWEYEWNHTARFAFIPSASIDAGFEEFGWAGRVNGTDIYAMSAAILLDGPVGGDPWDAWPAEDDGCPLLTTSDGDEYRVVLQAWYNPELVSSVYGGEGVFGEREGDRIYGEESGIGDRWVDLQTQSYGIEVISAGVDGDPIIPVDQVTVNMLDQAKPLTFDFDRGLAGGAPLPNDFIRVVVTRVTQASGYEYFPLFTGRVDSYTNEHQSGPRVVTLTAYGLATDLARPLPTYSTSLTTAQEQYDELMALAGWEYGPVPPMPGANGGRTLSAVPEETDVTVRTLIDRLALSAGCSFDTDADGTARMTPWPYVPDTSNTIQVSDCRRAGPELLSPRMIYAGDNAEVLNYAIRGNLDGQLAYGTDLPSIDTIGQHRATFGHPYTGLLSQYADLQADAQASVDRYGRTVNRIAGFDADTGVDEGWAAALCGLTRGQVAEVVRYAPVPLGRAGLVCGVVHSLTPGRWLATVYLTATGPSYDFSNYLTEADGDNLTTLTGDRLTEWGQSG